MNITVNEIQKKLKAVIYARYSSHNQREESIEGQLAKCQEYADNNNMDIVAHYIDRAISGTTDNRAEFQKMIKDCEKGFFDVVIVYSLDRFARNRYDSAIYKAKLKKNNVKIQYAVQSIPDTPEGIILESVMEGYAEYYSAELSRKVKRGLQINAEKGIPNGGSAPLGYKIVNQTYQIDISTADIVKDIFSLYLQCKSYRDVVKICNDKGYRTAKNNKFNVNSVARILQNEKYIGIYKYNDIIKRDIISPIIDTDVFEKVQAIIKKNERSGAAKKAKVNYLLSGKLFCGHCGSPMVADSGTSKSGKVYNYYKCNKRTREKSCDKIIEKKEILEKAVVSEVVKNILKPEVLDSIAKKIAELMLAQYDNNAKLLELQEKLKTTEKSIKNLLNLVEKGIETDDVTDRLLELNSLKSDLKKQITAEQIKQPPIDELHLRYWLESFLYGDIEDIKYQERIIDALVNSVFVFDNPDGTRNLVINCNVSEYKTIKITLKDVKQAIKCSDTVPSTAPSLKVPLITDFKAFLFL